MNLMKQHNISMNDTHVSISFFGQIGQNKDKHHKLTTYISSKIRVE